MGENFTLSSIQRFCPRGKEYRGSAKAGTEQSFLCFFLRLQVGGGDVILGPKWCGYHDKATMEKH